MKNRSLGTASVVASCILLLLIGGCGSSGNKEGVGALTNVGDTVCVQCHSAVQDPLTHESIITQYERSSPHRNSPFANAGNGCEACHGSASQHNGIGPIQFPNPFEGNGTRCAACHKGLYATDAPTKFAGSLHANMTVEAGGSCRRCHSHEGAVLGNVGGLTGDKDVMDSLVNQGFVPFTPTYSAFECATCHEHGAGLRTVMARDNNSNLVNWNPDKNQIPGQFDLCTSCHTFKDFTGNTLLASGTAAEPITGKPATGKVGHHESSWYRIIATTHYDNPATGLYDNGTPLPAGNVIEGYNLRTNTENPCFDCHGHEARTNTNQVTNPAIADIDKPTTIYTDWAMSNHAGGLLKAKMAAANAWPNSRVRNDPQGIYAVDSAMVSGVSSMDSGPVDITPTLKKATSGADAWVHYQWEKTLNADGTSYRGVCQRCHTATGSSNYLKNPATYDYRANDFSHLSGWKKATSTTATVGSPQQEVLYCWGCHRNAAKGLLWTPGAITADYQFRGLNGVAAAAVFPDVGASDICISCHSGLSSGESVVALADNVMGNVSFVNSHYLAVAGLMYVKSGFTAFVPAGTVIGTSTYGASLTANDDGGAISSAHRKLGTTAINGDIHNPSAFTPGNFDSNGPCVTCHMQATGQPTRVTSHTWDINLNAANQVCSKCHGTEVDTQAHLDAFIDGQAEPFQDALALALNQLMTHYNISYNPASYPYFFDQSNGGAAVKNWTRSNFLATPLSGADAKKLMGACFNINLLTREPAAYVHARTYVRRLLYDTIDFLDDGTINLSTGATALAYDPVVYIKGATADPPTTESYKYLAGYNRTTKAWNAIERP